MWILPRSRPLSRLILFHKPCATISQGFRDKFTSDIRESFDNNNAKFINTGHPISANKLRRAMLISTFDTYPTNVSTTGDHTLPTSNAPVGMHEVKHPQVCLIRVTIFSYMCPIKSSKKMDCDVEANIHQKRTNLTEITP